MDAYTKSRIAMLVIFLAIVTGMIWPLTKAMDAVLQTNVKRIEMVGVGK